MGRKVCKTGIRVRKGKLCLGDCLFHCGGRSIQKKDFVCEDCKGRKMPLSRCLFTKQWTFCEKKGNFLGKLAVRMFRRVSGKHNLIVFRSVSDAKLGAQRFGLQSACNVLDEEELSAVVDGLPFTLNTHDHKLLPVALGGGEDKSESDSEMEQVQKKKTLICPITTCQKLFKQRGNMNIHILVTHKREKRFECNHCGKRFGRKQNLTYHEITHSEKKAYQCAQCDRRFGRPDHLTRHQRTKHTLPCGVESCNKMFVQKKRLVNHVESEHAGLNVRKSSQKNSKTKRRKPKKEKRQLSSSTVKLRSKKRSRKCVEAAPTPTPAVPTPTESTSTPVPTPKSDANQTKGFVKTESEEVDGLLDTPRKKRKISKTKNLKNAKLEKNDQEKYLELCVKPSDNIDLWPAKLDTRMVDNTLLSEPPTVLPSEPPAIKASEPPPKCKNTPPSIETPLDFFSKSPIYKFEDAFSGSPLTLSMVSSPKEEYTTLKTETSPVVGQSGLFWDFHSYSDSLPTDLPFATSETVSPINLHDAAGLSLFEPDQTSDDCSSLTGFIDICSDNSPRMMDLSSSFECDYNQVGGNILVGGNDVGDFYNELETPPITAPFFMMPPSDSRLEIAFFGTGES